MRFGNRRDKAGAVAGGRWFRWLMLAALAVPALGGVLWGWDAYCVTRGGTGWIPEDAVVAVTAVNGGAFWKRLGETDLVMRTGMGLPRLPEGVERAFYDVTGRAASPLMWRLWWGRRVWGAYKDGLWGVCVQPGLLLRGRDWLERRGKGSHETAGGAWYQWVKGNLIVAPSREALDWYLGPRTKNPEVGGDERSIMIALNGQIKGEIRLDAADGLPVQGWCSMPITGEAKPLLLEERWGEPPLLSVTAGSWGDLWGLGKGLLMGVHGLGAVGDVVDRLSEGSLGWLPAGLDVRMDIKGEYGFGVMGLDFSGDLPMPGFGLLMRPEGVFAGDHPLLGLFGGLEPLDHEWNGRRGWRIPLMGEEGTVCLCDDGQVWLTTSQEPDMAGLLPGKLPETGPLAAVAVRVDWKKMADALERLLLRAAQYELLPRMNVEDVEARYVPRLRGLSGWGVMRLRFMPDAAGVVLEGKLAEAK